MWFAACGCCVLDGAGMAILIVLRTGGADSARADCGELEEHFHARVELDSFHVSLVDGLWAEGKGLRIWPPARLRSERAWQADGDAGYRRPADPAGRSSGFMRRLQYRAGQADQDFA